MNSTSPTKRNFSGLASAYNVSQTYLESRLENSGLGLSEANIKALGTDGNVFFVGDLVQLSEKNVLQLIPQFGPTKLKNLKEELRIRELHLGMNALKTALSDTLNERAEALLQTEQTLATSKAQLEWLQSKGVALETSVLESVKAAGIEVADHAVRRAVAGFVETLANQFIQSSEKLGVK